MNLTELEYEYLDARYEHSVTAQRCWKLRAALEREGLTADRERVLNKEFGAMVQRLSQ